MRYRKFGATGLEVSELVFGGGAVGGLLIDARDEIKASAVERALAAGINWFDTAASYGKGRSEQTLGRLLAGVANPPHLSTKFTVDTRDLSDLAGQIEDSVTASLTRLKRDSVTLLQLHNRIGPRSDGRTLSVNAILGPGGVLEELESLRRQGLVEHFGITALGETASIIEVIDSGRIASAQVYYNLLNPSAGRVLPPSWPVFDFGGVLEACERNGVAAMNIRVLSAGVLATDDRHGKERPLTPGDTVESETRKAQAMFGALGEAHGSRAQSAIRFALSEPRFACVVFGLADLEHLEEALAAEALGPLDDAALAQVDAVYQKGPGG